MVLDDIMDMLEKRRQELVATLETREDIQLERQHQIYGAINEIDIFLTTLNNFEQTRQNDDKDIGPIKLVKPPADEKPIFSKLYESLFSKIKKNR